MLPLTDAPWYVAQVRPNCLPMAVRGLTRQGFGLFLPKIILDPKKTSRGKRAWVPLFPGYIFVRFDPTRPAWRAINSTRGVSKLVSFGADGPRPVPGGLIGALQARCDDNGMLLAPDDLAPGDRVRLLRGPFADIVTEIERVEPDRRIWLLIDIMGRQPRVGVDFEDLARA